MTVAIVSMEREAQVLLPFEKRKNFSSSFASSHRRRSTWKNIPFTLVLPQLARRRPPLSTPSNMAVCALWFTRSRERPSFRAPNRIQDCFFSSSLFSSSIYFLSFFSFFYIYTHIPLSLCQSRPSRPPVSSALCDRLSGRVEGGQKRGKRRSLCLCLSL